MNSLGWWGPMAVNSITITILLVKSSLNLYCVVITGMMGCCCSHCGQWADWQPTGWRANGQLFIMNVTTSYWQANKHVAIVRLETRRGRSARICYYYCYWLYANKPQIMYWNPVTSLDVICHVLSCSCRHWKLLGLNCVYFSHSEAPILTCASLNIPPPV